MAVIRLDERADDDGVETLLFSVLLVLGGDSGVEVSGDPLASYTWEEVPPDVTLITPVGCKDIWVQFKKDIESKLKQTDDVEAKVSGFKQLPFKSDDYVDFEDNCKEFKSLPYWAKVGVWLLGVGLFVAFLWCHRIDLAIPLFAKLADDGVQLVKDFPQAVKQVKTGYKKNEGNILPDDEKIRGGFEEVL